MVVVGFKYFNVRNFRGEKISRLVPNREISCFRGDLISRLQTRCFFRGGFFRGDLISRLQTKCFFRGDLISRILSFNRETAKFSHIKVDIN